MPLGEVNVTGLRELNRALAKADRQTRKIVTSEFKQVAEPIRADAQSRASGEIRNIGDKWPRMRTGTTRTSVYVAPRERGRLSRRNPALRRPNLAVLLMNRAMQPALEHGRPAIERRVEGALDRIADDFNR